MDHSYPIIILLGQLGPNDFFGFSPTVPGCWARGTTPEDAEYRTREVIEKHIDSMSQNPEWWEKFMKINEAGAKVGKPGDSPQDRMLEVASRQIEEAMNLGLDPYSFVYELSASLSREKSGRASVLRSDIPFSSELPD